MGECRLQRAFRFAFVRNPWDKVVSHYHYRVRTGATALDEDFAEVCRRIAHPR